MTFSNVPINNITNYFKRLGNRWLFNLYDCFPGGAFKKLASSDAKGNSVIEFVLSWDKYKNNEPIYFKYMVIYNKCQPLSYWDTYNKVTVQAGGVSFDIKPNEFLVLPVGIITSVYIKIVGTNDMATLDSKLSNAIFGHCEFVLDNFDGYKLGYGQRGFIRNVPYAAFNPTKLYPGESGANTPSEFVCNANGFSNGNANCTGYKGYFKIRASISVTAGVFNDSEYPSGSNLTAYYIFPCDKNGVIQQTCGAYQYGRIIRVTQKSDKFNSEVDNNGIQLAIGGTRGRVRELWFRGNVMFFDNVGPGRFDGKIYSATNYLYTNSPGTNTYNVSYSKMIADPNLSTATLLGNIKCDYLDIIPRGNMHLHTGRISNKKIYTATADFSTVNPVYSFGWSDDLATYLTPSYKRGHGWNKTIPGFPASGAVFIDTPPFYLDCAAFTSYIPKHF